MSDSKETCPIDPKSHEIWMSQARAAGGGTPSESQTRQLPPTHPPTGDAEANCPVDHKAREVWLRQQQKQDANTRTTTTAAALRSTASPTSPSWSSALLSYVPFTSRASPATTKAPSQTASSSLDTNRVISSIPRTTTPGDSACPANQEQETGADTASGNWIYPSEKMFFDAMKRKGHDPQSTDMRTVVPIHNAVNERAWAEIKEWEAPWIKGSSTKMTPKARINTLLGYQAPFDRHDWVVDRCGKEVEYVIDFYAGRNTGAGKLSFYLDVRPKLNSWEGVKMRVMRGLGIV